MRALAMRTARRYVSRSLRHVGAEDAVLVKQPDLVADVQVLHQRGLLNHVAGFGCRKAVILHEVLQGDLDVGITALYRVRRRKIVSKILHLLLQFRDLAPGIDDLLHETAVRDVRLGGQHFVQNGFVVGIQRHIGQRFRIDLTIRMRFVELRYRRLDRILSFADFLLRSVQPLNELLEGRRFGGASHEQSHG